MRIVKETDNLPLAKDANILSAKKVQERKNYAVSEAISNIRSAIELGKFEAYAFPDYDMIQPTMDFLRANGYKCEEQSSIGSILGGSSYNIKIRW